MINEDIVSKTLRMLREGEQILKDKALIRNESLRVQNEKDKEYNKEYLKTTDKEWKMRIDQTFYRGSTSPTWWYLPTKDVSGFMQECYAKWFWCDVSWFHEVWDKWFDMPYAGMMTICISKAKKKGYFPIRYKYKELLYDTGNHMSWSLHHCVSNPRHLLFSGWVGVSQGIREFIWGNMDYTPEKYPDEKEFVLWFKIKEIRPKKY